MQSAFQLKRRHYYPLWFVLLSIFLGGCIWGFHARGWIDDGHLFEASISALGISAGFTHFLYSSYMEQTKLFHELAREFNERYDRLNSRLNQLREQKSIPQQIGIERSKALSCLYDYFNLCAEEYLYYQAGHIDPNVWKAWCVGMKDFADVPDIAKEWRKELERPSYYGFDLDRVIETSVAAAKECRRRQV